jgi:hypothetical protein
VVPALVLVSAAITACGGGAPTERCDGREILLVNCSGCHDGSMAGLGAMDLRRPEETLPLFVGQLASGAECVGTGRVLLEPGGGAGLLLQKLRSPPPCGARMPEGTFPLSPEEITCVERWVAALVGNP